MRPLVRAALAAAGLVVLLATLTIAGRDLQRPTAGTSPQPSAPPAPAETSIAPVPAETATATATALPTPTTGSASRDPAVLLAAHNALRAAAGAPPVRADARVTAAAQRHAEYLALNAAGGHAEEPGRPGFTGASVRDRLIAQGFGEATASEVATSGSGAAAVGSLWVLPYHRLGLMHPHAVLAGWGVAESGGREVTVGVLVYDFAAAAPEVIRSPASNERDVPLQWDGREDVDVAPGAPRPLGYTVMALYSRARSVTVRATSLSTGGRAIDHVVAPQIYERDYVAIVPLAPLAPGTRYRVRLELTVGGVDLVDEWEFETRR